MAAPCVNTHGLKQTNFNVILPTAKAVTLQLQTCTDIQTNPTATTQKQTSEGKRQRAKNEKGRGWEDRRKGNITVLDIRTNYTLKKS